MEQKEQKRLRLKKKMINRGLLILGGGMALSGLIIQCHYHLLKNPDDSRVLGFGRPEWNTLHVWTSIGFLAVVSYHAWGYRKKPTVLLTLLMLVVVITAFLPLIEVHDKVAILFLIVLLRHVIKRRKRNTKKKTTPTE